MSALSLDNKGILLRTSNRDRLSDKEQSGLSFGD
jgi:hypothetical protein